MSAMEIYQAPAPPVSDREWTMLERKSAVLAKSGLIPKGLQNKPSDIMAIALTARDLGMELTLTTLKQFHVIDGAVSPSAQLLVALAMAHGHETWWVESDDTHATIAIRRRNSERVQQFSWTVAMAQKAGLLDEWVERWAKTASDKSYKETYVLGSTATPPAWAKALIDAGQIKCRENWRKYPADMLMARAAGRAIRHVCPEVALGLTGMVIDPASDAVVAAVAPLVEHPEDGDIAEGNVVEVSVEPSGPKYVSQSWVTALAKGCAELALELGVDPNHLREALVEHITDGRTRHSSEVLASETHTAKAAKEAIRSGALRLEATEAGYQLVDVTPYADDEDEAESC